MAEVSAAVEAVEVVDSGAEEVAAAAGTAEGGESKPSRQCPHSKRRNWDFKTTSSALPWDVGKVVLVQRLIVLMVYLYVVRVVDIL